MKKDNKLAYLHAAAEESAILRRSAMEQLAQQLIDTSAVISGVLGSGGKILMAGNGGSAADASHFATEMIVRLSGDNNRQSLAALALCADPSVMTAAANDFGFENVFARQVEGLGQKGDMLFLISTSGNSKNLIRAATTAKDMGLITVALLGGTGGKLVKLVDRSLVVPDKSTQRIQEEHIFMIHLLVELIEGDLF